jgi:hypothetical protein
VKVTEKGAARSLGYISVIKVRRAKKSRLISTLWPVLILFLLGGQACLAAGSHAAPCADANAPHHHETHVLDKCGAQCCGLGSCSMTSTVGPMNVVSSWESSLPLIPAHDGCAAHVPSVSFGSGNDGTFQAVRITGGRTCPIFLINLHLLC